MPRRATTRLIVAMLLASQAPAAAQSLNDGLADATTLLERGSATEALDLLQQLQVDHPDSEAIGFGKACALYQQARAVEAPAPAEEPSAPNTVTFDAARDEFALLTGSEDPKVARLSAFNLANTYAEEAKRLDPQQQYREKVSAWRQAVREFEKVSKQYPDLARAQQNLRHARFELKTLLQNPPEQPEQEQQQPPPQQAVIYGFNSATTQLPQSKAEVSPDSKEVRLVRPGQKGANP